MTRIAYFDCFAGVSGDMVLGAMVDAGLPLADLRADLEGLQLGGYELSAEKVERSGLAATLVRVRVDETLQQPQRSLDDVLELVRAGHLPDTDKERISSVFELLAAAEGRVHGRPADSVHFHEVGAVDAIVDIAGVVAGLRLLNVESIYCSPLPLGFGLVKTAHGTLPAPAPATLAIIEQNGLPTRGDPAPDCGEITTPTGAAIMASLATFERPPFPPQRVGHGAGGRDPDSHANVLRVWLGDERATKQARQMLLLETNIDDMPAEQLAHALERVLDAGAVDAWFTPIQMKKGRPATMLSALCAEELEETLVEAILRETSTLGVRVRAVRRHEAEREIVRFQSSLGEVGLKVKRLHGEAPRFAPEFEDCRRIALARDIPLVEVFRIVSEEASRGLR